jgi:uroporphyrinogen-III synthase
MKNILLTRPHEQSMETAEILSFAGYKVEIAPLLKISFGEKNINHILLDENVSSNSVKKIFVITSANGVSALAKNTYIRNSEMVTVGKSSADKAKELGFTNVKSCIEQGDSDSLKLIASNQESLAKYINAKYDKDTEIIHIKGSNSNNGLSEALSSFGFKYSSVLLYEVSKQSFTSEIVNSLREKYFDAVLIYSPKTAKFFLEEIENNNLEDSLDKTKCFCLSEKASQILQNIKFSGLYNSKNNYSEEMIELVKENL